MFKQIKLSNFRRHTDLTVNFDDGLTVLRGGNEAGKSTVLLAISYALFGVKALPLSLEETVTHGEPVNTLKVVLTAVIDGVEYVIKRSKNGSEINYDDGRVTGQTETTNFLCAKMGVDPAMAAKLMLSAQNEIRGALDAGTKATTELIERLSEFDQIDLLVERMQERLTLGSTTLDVGSLADSEQRLIEARTQAVKPDMAALTVRLEAERARVTKAQEAEAALGAESLSAQAHLDNARGAQAAFEQAEANLAKARRRASKFSEDLAEAKRAAGAKTEWPVSEGSLRKELADLEQASKHLQAHARLAPLLGEPKPTTAEVPTTTEHSPSGLKAHIADLKEAERLAQSALGDIGNKLYMRRSDLTSGTCSWCGQDFSHLPEVAAKNAQAQAEIDQLTAAEADVKAKLVQVQAELATLNAIQAASVPRLAALEANPDYVERVGTALPPTLRWIGPNVADLVGAEARLQEIGRTLRQMQSTLQAEQASEARYNLLVSQQADVDAEVSAAAQAVTSAELRPSLDDAIARRDAVAARRRPISVELSDATTAVRDLEYEIRDTEREFKRAAERVEQLEASIEKLKAEIKATEFNNALLKRVRQCRPLIADKLWTIVLNAVSGYFSEMRGVRSTVTKDSDGFKVDGYPVAGLSGSTLDILGLAIRVALTRTFLPNAPFMVLDEPCAAMDTARTESTLGFIVACGFKQILWTTHEGTSQTVADHLIVLGETA